MQDCQLLHTGVNYLLSPQARVLTHRRIGHRVIVYRVPYLRTRQRATVVPAYPRDKVGRFPPRCEHFDELLNISVRHR